jgi:hypothetical protein
MSVWTAPPLDAKAFAAIAALGEPSRPQPLPGSRRAGERVWRTALGRDAVIKAYSKKGAPVPAGSTLVEQDGVLVVRAPFGDTCVMFGPAQTGASYSLIPGPTLHVDGKGVPTGDRYGACGIDDMNLNTGKPQISVVAFLKEGDQQWLLWVSENEDGKGKGMGLLEPVKPEDLHNQDNSPLEGKAKPATIRRTASGVETSFKRGSSTIKVAATRTHSMCALLTTMAPAPEKLDPSHRLMCVTKTSSGPMDQRIQGVGGVTAGKPWRLDAATIIARIEAGERFYVQEPDGEDPVFVTVDKGTSGTKYPLAKKSGDRRNLVAGLSKCRKVSKPVTPP